MEKLSALKDKIDVKYLNPLQCNMSFMHCNTFLYFVAGMIAVFTLLLFISRRYSRVSLMLTTLCLCMIFIGCSLILLNVCVANQPDIYSYITIGFAVLSVLLILTVFKPAVSQ